MPASTEAAVATDWKISFHSIQKANVSENKYAQTDHSSHEAKLLCSKNHSSQASLHMNHNTADVQAGFILFLFFSSWF